MSAFFCFAFIAVSVPGFAVTIAISVFFAIAVAIGVFVKVHIVQHEVHVFEFFLFIQNGSIFNIFFGSKFSPNYI